MSGLFTFKWSQPGATEVYVTGTFDNWTQSIKLEKNGEIFEKTVTIAKEKALYKFVVDHNWLIDPKSPIEKEEGTGIENNVLHPFMFEEEKPTEEPSEMSNGFINSAAADSSTAELAAQVPLEGSSNTSNGLAAAAAFKNATIQSAAPDSSTAALAANVPKENAPPVRDATISSVAPVSSTAALAANVPFTESVGDVTISSAAPDTTTAELAAHIPVETQGSDAVPGDFPDTPALERQEQVFSVNPLPASDTATNPISLAPGEPVPQVVGAQSLTSNVTLDKESYEAGARNYPIGNFVLPDVVTPVEQCTAEGRGVLGLPAITGAMIPESSLPIVAAADVNKTAEVPEIVKGSQAVAHASAEASAVPEAVENKAEMEQELKNGVAAAPATAEGPTLASQATDVASKAATQASEVASTVADKATIRLVDEGATVDSSESKTADLVPEAVRDSIAQAHVPAEAAAVASVVGKKEVVEAQLKKEVPHVAPAAGTDTPVETVSTARSVTPIITSSGPVPYDKANEEAPPTSPNVSVSPNGSLKGNNGEGGSGSEGGGRKAKRKSLLGRICEKVHFW